MIQEDYVSLEIARLLSEKKFNEECLMRYVDEELMNVYDSDFPSAYELDNCGSEVIDAPTLQMAMKWLRQVHNFHVDSSIYIDTDGDSEHEYSYTYWDWTIFNSESGRRIAEPQIGCDRYDTYEEACEVAIKYCLENLI